MLARLFVLASRIRSLFGGERLDRDFVTELDSHLAMLVDEYVRRGLTREAAVREARLALGGSTQLLESHRERRGVAFLQTTLQDVRYACRTLRRNPAFAAVAVLTLGIGIGAVTSMFTVVRAVLLRPLPYEEPERLVEITETNPVKAWTHTSAAVANFADWRARNTVFTDVAGYVGVDDRGASQLRRSLEVDGEPQAVKGIVVTGNLFDVLGVAPRSGRTFRWDEAFEGRDRVVVISYGTWQSVFGGDPQVIGRSVSLSGRTVTVIGVMPRDFFFPNRTVEFWAPYPMMPDMLVKMRRPHFLNTIARLRPGASLQRARDQMRRIAADLEREYPDTNTKMGVRLEPLHGIMAADARPTVLMLFGAVTVLFLIVCANVASLQLGRAAARTREIAVRRALGAGRIRLVRQLMTEAFVLSSAGTAIGVVVAAATPAALLHAAPSALPLFATPRIDVAVLSFAVALGLLAPVVFGFAPALSSSHADRLAERAESASRQATFARNVLVVFEVALSVVLVTESLLLVRSLIRLQQVDPGFTRDRVVSFVVTLPRLQYPKDADQVRAFTSLEEQLRRLPGVTAVGATSRLALRGYTWTGDATIEGRSGDDYERELRHESVTPDYFSAMGIRLIAGRMLTNHDGAESNVTLVNETLAKSYFHGADPVGTRIKFGRPTDDAPWTTIVGVVADQKQDGLDKPVRPEVYVPYAANAQNPATFVIRAAVAPESIVTTARSAVRAVSRNALLTDVTTLDDLVRQSAGDERFRTTLLAGFAVIALFLASLGIYGVLAYLVAQRSRELGIRLALGAKPRELFTMVVGQGMWPVGVGAMIGIGAVIALTRAIASLLFGIAPLDPVSYAFTAGVLALSALIACAVPAARAMRVDPIVTLREE